MRVIVVTAEPGHVIGFYSCPDTANGEQLADMTGKIYNKHRDEMKAAFCTLHPGRKPSEVKCEDIPMLATQLAEVWCPL